MRKVLETSQCVVYDDVLSEEAWSDVWTYFQYEDLDPTTRTVGAWKLGDGQPFAGPSFHAPAPEVPREALSYLDGLYPTEAPVDHLLEVLMNLAPQTPQLGEGWIHMSGRAYVYPTGTGLSWHRDDHARFAGAFIYYAHPTWNAQWGGELLIGDVDDPLEMPVMPHRFDNRAFSASLMDKGIGSYILAKPNRLVLLGAAPHRVTPITPAAGDNIRASLAGFFVRPGGDEESYDESYDEESYDESTHEPVL